MPMVVYTFIALAKQRHRTLKNVCFTISTGTRKIILIIPIKCESLCVLSHLSVSLSHSFYVRCDVFADAPQRQWWQNKASIITWISRNGRRMEQLEVLLFSLAFLRLCILCFTASCIYAIITSYELWMLFLLGIRLITIVICFLSFSGWRDFFFGCLALSSIGDWKRTHKLRVKCWRDKISKKFQQDQTH